MGEFEYRERSWLTEYDGWEDPHEESIGIRYLVSLYFFFTTMTTVGYGDISPVTPYEQAYAIFIQLAGVSFCFAILCNAVGQVYSAKEKTNDEGKQIYMPTYFIITQNKKSTYSANKL